MAKQRDVHYSPHDRPMFWISVVTVAVLLPPLIASLNRGGWWAAAVTGIFMLCAVSNAVRTWRAMH